VRSCVDRDLRQHTFWRLRWGRKILVNKTDLIYSKKMGSNTEIDKENIIPSYEHLPEDVRLLLEERKKKRVEEDLQAALASIKVGRCGKVTKIKEIDFTSTSSDASTEVTPVATAPPSGVTMEQI